MRRWRKKSEDDEDDVLTFDNIDDDEEDEKPRRRYKIPKSPIRTRFSSTDDDEDLEEGASEDEDGSFENLEPLIRAGKYKPKPSDHYTVHLLYQTLRDLGEI